MILCELDYKAIEAVLVGYFAQDPQYIRAAKLGVHAILASYILKNQGLYEPIDLGWSDADILKAVAEVKTKFPKEYDDAKHASHGSNYGGTPKKLMMDFPESFPSMKYAEWVQALYFGTIAKKVRAWQDAVIEKAFRECCLDNPFKYRHYFFDALKFQKVGAQWKKIWGTDAKRILAFLPQSTAAGIIKEAMLVLGPRVGPNNELIPARVTGLGLLLQGHDALLFEFPEETMAEQIRYAQGVMERPFMQLDGLSIEVEVKVGRSWGRMSEWKFYTSSLLQHT